MVASQEGMKPGWVGRMAAAVEDGGGVREAVAGKLVDGLGDVVMDSAGVVLAAAAATAVGVKVVVALAKAVV